MSPKGRCYYHNEGVPPRCDVQTSYFLAFLWSEMLVFTVLLFRSYRKWQLFLVSCVFFVLFRTLFINLAPQNAGIYSTRPSEFLDFCCFLKSRFSCPKPTDQNEGVFGLILITMFIQIVGNESIHVQNLMTYMVSCI